VSRHLGQCAEKKHNDVIVCSNVHPCEPHNVVVLKYRLCRSVGDGTVQGILDIKGVIP
jgi:hypothetical protein